MTPTAAFAALPAYLPSPSRGVWHLGPLPIRAYALCIIAGIVVAIWLTDLRWRARGGSIGTVGTLATWAVPFGLVGGRLYHLITDPELYFTKNDWHPWRAFAVWDGGLGIWGAIALGALGVWIASRRHGVVFPAFADAAAPGIVLAQGIGRWGNYFNQELFGKPTTMPWGLKIDADHSTSGVAGVYQPTFLYECVWDVGTALLVIWADRRFKLGHGRAFLLYVMAYTAGRGWIEYLRVDHANHILGLRLNDWTSLLVFAGALITYLVSLHRAPGREPVVERASRAAAGTTPQTQGVSAAASGEAAGEDPSDLLDATGPPEAAVAPGPPEAAVAPGSDGTRREQHTSGDEGPGSTA
jgi:phosphatidylglycerol---prolipoprotein diacylglyceryl transferase